jgi:hypothetical protein
MRLNVSRASSSVIRMMRVRLNVRAAALSKKCSDMGPIPCRDRPSPSPWKSSSNSIIFQGMIMTTGPNPDVVVYGPVNRSNDDRLRL